MANYDILGNIAIVKFPEETSKDEKEKKAKEILEQYKGVKTVLEKSEKIKGRLRTYKTRHILGEKNLIADYKENGCRFKLKVDSCYFSPRLAHERLEIAEMIRKLNKNPRILVMFAGVAPFTTVVAKNLKFKKIVSIELGKECCKYAKMNLLLNKIYSGVDIIQGDVKKVISKLIKDNKKEKFDIILMPRPNLKETFLSDALKVSKKGTFIVYYGFSPETKKQEMIEELEKEAEMMKRKIKILDVKEAGDIAPYEHRYRIEIKVLK